jgi:predicted glycosyltransferase
VKPRRVFLYVQHLLGIGHLKRAATLAQAFAAQGMDVTLASGGAPAAGLTPAGVRLVQLPPASAADLDFRTLVDAEGRPVDEAWKRKRAAALLAAWRESGAQALVLELFPFGRRQMRFELLPLLDAVSASAPRAAVLCSVRDILGGLRTSERQLEAVDLVERHVDCVLVHGDPAVLPFERTFPAAARIAQRIAYTGYVVDAAAGPGDPGVGRGEVIVSAGGGAVGAPLLEAAIGARPLTTLRDRTWRLLAGNNLDDGEFRRLGRLVADTPGIVLERARADFASLLANAELSISQAGYNTLMETIHARARAVAVPFAGGRETEQSLRARCFAERGLLEVVEESALSAQSLAAAVDRAAAKPRPATIAVDLDGARKSAAIVAGLLRERAA